MFSHCATRKISSICKISTFSEDFSFLNLRSLNFTEFLCETVGSPIKTSNFPNSLKLVDITPSHKKCIKNNKENYGPVSLLRTLSKIFEIIF